MPPVDRLIDIKENGFERQKFSSELLEPELRRRSKC
jgi:hypothetical protein